MDDHLSKALVRTMLEHAQDFAWVIQDIGLLGLRLDDRKEFRLHLWDPDYATCEPPVHDHPFDFTSTIIAGEMTNTRYQEDASGVTYTRWRYSPADEDGRRGDAVTLSATAKTFREGDCYSQLAHELHSSCQVPGTVTIIRRSFKEAPDLLTVCHRDDSMWVSGQSRRATSDEVKRVTTKALERF
jgi:hypothetical protein